MAVVSGGITSSAASATSTMPSGRQAVCLVSRNQLARLARLQREARPLHASGRARGRVGRRGPSPTDRTVPHDGASDLHRATAGRQLRRPAGGGPGGRAAGLRRLLPVRPLPQDGRRDAACPGRPTRGSPSPAWPARRPRIRLGTLVTSATFRHPGPLAISVAQVDQMSGGRVELGLGAGWYDAEHGALRHPVPAARRAVRPAGGAARRSSPGLWGTPDGARYASHRPLLPGRRLARAAEAGAAARPPIIIGGGGTQPHARPLRPVRVRVQPGLRAARELRGPGGAGAARPARATTATRTSWCTRRRSCSASAATRPSCARRAAAIGREPAELRANGAAGTVPEVTATLQRWDEAGATRIYLQVLDLSDLDHLELVAAEVAPQLP